jgi:hypothetical protein
MIVACNIYVWVVTFSMAAAAAAGGKLVSFSDSQPKSYTLTLVNCTADGKWIDNRVGNFIIWNTTQLRTCYNPPLLQHPGKTPQVVT